MANAKAKANSSKAAKTIKKVASPKVAPRKPEAKTDKQAAVAPPRPDAVKIAREVLRLGHSGLHERVLSVLGDDVASLTGPARAAAARKAFLKISMMIHPDKLPDYPDATKAFQTLVQAFDGAQIRPPSLQESVGGKKALSRSNENCFRTEVRCPRCETPWGTRVEGSPDYYYNLMMQAIRCFTCCSCLLNFGCFSAVHICPWCKKSFEYDPSKYNSKMTCGHPSCKKPFGFMLYSASELALRAAQQLARDDFEKRAKQTESSNARSQRAARRGAGREASAEELMETAFLEGLRDICPRCGVELESLEDGAQIRHLRTCNDRQAHDAYKEKSRALAEASKSKMLKEQSQLSASSSAVWSFSGGLVSLLWMVDEKQLRKRCKEEGLSSTGSHAELVRRLASRGKSRGDPFGKPSETVPKVLETLSNEKLALICAAHLLTSLESREDMIEALEDLRDSGARTPITRRVADRSLKVKAIGNGGSSHRGELLALQDIRTSSPKKVCLAHPQAASKAASPTKTSQRKKGGTAKAKPSAKTFAKASFAKRSAGAAAQRAKSKATKRR